MRVIRRLTITTTTRRLVRGQDHTSRSDCPSCGHMVDTLDISQAAAVLEITPAQFQQLLADATVHTLPTVNGSLRICQNSLFPQ